MIAIIKGCGNNIASIQFALERLGKKSIITEDESSIKNALHVILPGVGHASKAMQRLKMVGLDKTIRELKQPVLGICLGMQLLYERSDEGCVDCLGVVPGTIRKFAQMPSYIIPHMGWNVINFIQPKHRLALSITNNSYAYFVHSFFAPLNEYSIAETNYIEKFTSVVHYKNFIGMQFHPERSGRVGENLLKSFIEMR